MPIQQKNRRQEEDFLYSVLTAAWKAGEKANADAVACALAIITPNQKISDLFVIGYRAQNNRVRMHYDGGNEGGERGRGETWRSSCVCVSWPQSWEDFERQHSLDKVFLLLVFEG